MRKLLLTFLVGMFLLNAEAQQSIAPIESTPKVDKKYKALMYDNTVNFYTVVEEAEKYFSTIDRFAKGSGWKGFERWRVQNEYKYFPSGDRTKVDPEFAKKQFQRFLKQSSNDKKLFASGWKDLGPYTIDSITGHYSAGLGRVEDFYVDPSDSNLIYLGSRSGGFWKSTDGGENWTGGSTDTLFASGVDIITVSPTNPDSILINLRNAQNGYSHGIYRSIDGGASWTLSNFNPTKVGRGGLGSNFRIYSVKYHPRIKDLVLVGTNSGLYRSNDNLQSWSRIERGRDIDQITFHPTVDSIVYFTDNYYWSNQPDAIFYSLDTGKTFTASSTIEKSTIPRTMRLSVSNDCPDCLYYASTNGVWRSVDQGKTFTALANPNETCRAFAVSNLDTSNMIYGYLNLESSTNGGQSFTETAKWSLGSTNGAGNGHHESYKNSTNYIHADMRNAKYVGGKFYVATDGFLSKSSDNGTSWEIISEGTGIRENYSLGVSQSNHYRTISGSQDNGSSFLTEKGWVEAYGADGMEGFIHPLNEDYTVFSLQYGGRRKSTNGAFTNYGVTPSGGGSAAWIAPLAYDPNDHFTVYDFRDSVYKSTDFAENYEGIGKPSSFTGFISSAAIAENNSDIMVVAQSSSIQKSDDGGVTFSNIGSGLPNSTIQDIAFDPKNDSVLIVVYGDYINNGNKIYLSTNLGSSWTNITHNLGSMPIRSVVIDHSDSSNIYVGAEIGVYVKPMSSSNWELYNQGLPNMSVREMEINYGSNTIRAASWGRGLWEYNLKDRADFPAILTTDISQSPTYTTPKEGVDQWVTSTISFGGNLSSVFVKWSVNDIELDSSIVMQLLADSTWESKQPLPNAKFGDKVYFKVFAVGNNQDTTETYRYMYEVREGGFCTATGNNNSGNLYLSNVTLENLNNSTVNNSYTLYTSTVVEIYADSVYDLTVQANTNWLSNDFAAWIDFDKDYDFESSEQVLNDENSGMNADINFTVPNSVREGDTIRMRVRLSYFGSPDACGDQFGEVEDYLLLIKKVPELTYQLNKDSLCYGENLNFEFTGGNVDSLEWTFTNGTNVFTSTAETASIGLTANGDYDLRLKIYYEGIEYQLDSMNALFVRDSFQLGITQSSSVLTAEQAGVNYQWINCTNGNVNIAGANSQSYTPSSNGFYAVELSNSNCSYTSSCLFYNVVGIKEVEQLPIFKMYPNPTNGQLVIETDQIQMGSSLQIIDLAGNLILERKIRKPKETVNLENLAKGLYFVRYKNEFQKWMIVD